MIVYIYLKLSYYVLFFWGVVIVCFFFQFLAYHREINFLEYKTSVAWEGLEAILVCATSKAGNKFCILL